MKDPTVVYMVGRVDRGIRRELQRRLAPWALNVSAFTAMSVLAARSGLSNAQLARRSLVTPQSMNEVLAELERRGLVTRSDDPDHSRIRRAELTDAGRQVLAEAAATVDEFEASLLRDVAPADRAALLRSLHVCLDVLARAPHGRR